MSDTAVPVELRCAIARTSKQITEMREDGISDVAIFAAFSQELGRIALAMCGSDFDKLRVIAEIPKDSVLRGGS